MTQFFGSVFTPYELTNRSDFDQLSNADFHAFLGAQHLNVYGHIAAPAFDAPHLAGQFVDRDIAENFLEIIRTVIFLRPALMAMQDDGLSDLMRLAEIVKVSGRATRFWHENEIGTNALRRQSPGGMLCSFERQEMVIEMVAAPSPATNGEAMSEADRLIAECSGDARAALQNLIEQKQELECELELALAAVSHGFSRGWHHRAGSNKRPFPPLDVEP